MPSAASGAASALRQVSDPRRASRIIFYPAAGASVTLLRSAYACAIIAWAASIVSGSPGIRTE